MAGLVPVLRHGYGGRRAIGGWGPGLAAAQSEEESESLSELVARCKPARRPAEYGPIDYMEPSEIQNCASTSALDLLGEHAELTDIATASVTDSSEVVLLTQRRGPFYQLDVYTDGEFCDLTSVMVGSAGFWVVDEHRVTQFNFSWSPEAVEESLAEVGQFNIEPDGSELVPLWFPTAVAKYKPLNESFFDDSFRITPFFPDATNELLFITDTGHHRVLMLNITGSYQLDVIGQFGVTGIALADSTGLDWPHGIAVTTPAAEASFEPVIANVFVADRRNHRLVKLNVGYPLDGSGRNEHYRWYDLSLLYGGAYGGRENPVPWNETLEDPVGVSVYRHYVLVAEGLGNAITLLKVHHVMFDRLIFVTRLTPALGVQLTGHLAVSMFGYIWYTYKELPTSYGMGTIFLDEALRESPPSEMLDELAAQCYNDTWFHTEMLFNYSVYMDTLGYMLNATRTNWEYPDLPNYVDIFSFNATTYFDIDLLNETVFRGRFQVCQPPVISTTPAMLSGNSDGWSSNTATVAAFSSRQQH
eukprot:CAMPEP_0115311832 /NCGR_PEP_ID=MMETSP0270-20121206/75560_1 /TAXON_ID=71861 /ORGANISM="Scrippsiella trochoidea, Strain CCMP3099" /LENGTH=529 /DNA_ID=CAMNT_0002730719 /DNA_START=117 /DNA_END=1703 /DNA_ORIENTATION=-